MAYIYQRAIAERQNKERTVREFNKETEKSTTKRQPKQGSDVIDKQAEFRRSEKRVVYISVESV